MWRDSRDLRSRSGLKLWLPVGESFVTRVVNFISETEAMLENQLSLSESRHVHMIPVVPGWQKSALAHPAP